MAPYEIMVSVARSPAPDPYDRIGEPQTVPGLERVLLALAPMSAVAQATRGLQVLDRRFEAQSVLWPVPDIRTGDRLTDANSIDPLTDQAPVYIVEGYKLFAESHIQLTLLRQEGA